MTGFCVLVSLFFLITCLFSDFGFNLSVLYPRYVSISLDIFTVKLTLDVFITDVCKFVLFIVSMLCVKVSDVVFFSAIFRNRFLSWELIIGARVTFMFFKSWFINEFMILPLFLGCSLRNRICSSWCFISLSDISLVEFLRTC